MLGRNGQPMHGRRRRHGRPAPARRLRRPNPRKSGDNLFTGTPAARGTGRCAPARSRARAPTRRASMVDMIASLRAFEAGQKVIQTIDETLGKAAHQVGSMNG